MNIIKFAGIIILLMGIADFGLSYTEYDTAPLYWDIMYYVPDLIYPFTAWVLMGAGFAAMKAGGVSGE